MKQVPQITVHEGAKLVKDGADPDGTSKIVPKCTLPLTAIGVVDMMISDLAISNYN